MPLVIDPLSVATQGFVETLGLTVEADRDSLRISTLGWILVDFALVPTPNPSDPTYASITNPFLDSDISSGKTQSFVAERLSSADIGDNVSSYQVAFSFLVSEETPKHTDASLSPGEGSAKLEARNLETSDTEGPGSVKITNVDSVADVDPTNTDAKR